MDVCLQNAPADEPIFQFLDRKRAEGKPYYVYMTAGANKFLRRYYAQVNDYLKTLEPKEAEPSQETTAETVSTS